MSEKHSWLSLSKKHSFVWIGTAFCSSLQANGTKYAAILAKWKCSKCSQNYRVRIDGVDSETMKMQMKEVDRRLEKTVCWKNVVFD